MAINDAIFAKHLVQTHFKVPEIDPPMHTLCIKAGNLRFHVRGTRREYRLMETQAQDIIYAAVGEAHVKDQHKKYHDPLLKLYYGRPLYINQNEDVAGCVANGAMCEFRGIKLKAGVTRKEFETIIIDGYYVNCVSVTQIETLLVNMLDGSRGMNEQTIIQLSPKSVYASARFPVPFTGPITKKSMRTQRRISFEQFPINCANARTVHKLQGRSIKHLVVSAWDYTGNWIYVCLSRCTSMKGLFLREPSNPSKTRGMSDEQDYVVQQAVFRNCPKQNNSHDCGLFAVAVIWHLLEGKEIHSSVFTQDHIGALREALYRGLSSNAEWATLENVSSFFPALLPPVRNEPSPDQDGALVHETGPEDEEPKEDEEVVAETHPENFIHDVEDEIFERKFSEPSQVFQTVEELMVVINDYQEASGNSLAIRGSRGSSRVFACISYANCSFRVAFGPKARQEGIILKRGNCNLLHSGAAVTAAKDGRCLKKSFKEVIKQLANDAALHKHAPPTANDVIKAGVHKKKTLLSYKQCYRGVNARNESKIISDSMCFQLVGPSEWKGTLYLATVKSAGDDLYPVASAITVDGEDFQGWVWFLQHLKASAPNLIAEHFRRECSYKLFTFMSDRCKGLTNALGNVFPANHNCYCAVHIRRNVESNHGKKFASMVTALSKTTSLPEKRALLTQLQQKSPGAYKYVTDVDANRWMDSAWPEDEKLPPRYGFRNSNISEFANNMFNDARNGNWLDAIDGILIKMSFRITKSQSE
ncbi:MULE transposase domain containing protein [Nitzschia inconspicua]|uniref:MULE transposase domain containing protein n=1 Tax=Nitzschia inconspicua TaxID=303405 RepID=A0A9K3KL87_9STRA|nr:MULE transposase domain containing protein [Nitzschia inconspicua]